MKKRGDYLVIGNTSDQTTFMQFICRRYYTPSEVVGIAPPLAFPEIVSSVFRPLNQLYT